MQLETFFPYRLAIAAEAFSRSLTEVYQRDFGLSREEWRLLFLLQGGSPITSAEVQRRTTLDKVQVSRATRRLERKGLITRDIADADRRLRSYRATPEGGALFAAALPRVEARARAILGSLTPEERAALETGIAALLHALTAPTPDEGARRGAAE